MIMRTHRFAWQASRNRARVLHKGAAIYSSACRALSMSNRAEAYVDQRDLHTARTRASPQRDHLEARAGAAVDQDVLRAPQPVSRPVVARHQLAQEAGVPE